MAGSCDRCHALSCLSTNPDVAQSRPASAGVLHRRARHELGAASWMWKKSREVVVSVKPAPAGVQLPAAPATAPAEGEAGDANC